MKISLIAAAVGMALGGATTTAQAALTTGTVLQFTPGNLSTYTSSTGAGASYFSMQVSPSTVYYTGLTAGLDGGIQIGAAQPLPPGVYTHSGAPFGGTYTTDVGAIDSGWNFLGSTGLHFSSSPINVATDNGTTKTLDFSGWSISWDGNPSISLSGGMQVVSSYNTKTSTTGYTTHNNGTGLATITCSTSSCSNSSSFTLDYSAVIARKDPSNLGGVPYALHLTGHVNAVPVPAAAWLFGSGLAGLIGVAGRKKARE